MSRFARHSIALTLFAGLAATTLPGLAQTTNPQDALKAATDRMNAIKGATGAQPSKPGAPASQSGKFPPGDPCSLIPLSTVRSIFPTVKSGENTHRIEDLMDATECVWKDAAGAAMLSLQDSFNSDNTSAKADATDWAGLYTYSRGKAGTNVRIETFPGIGADNAGFAELTDPQRNIKHDIAYIQLHKGKYSVGIGAMGLAGRDRPQMLKALETLGKDAASRM